MWSPSSRTKKNVDLTIYSLVLLTDSGFREEILNGQKAQTMLGHFEILYETYDLQ